MTMPKKLKIERVHLEALVLIVFYLFFSKVFLVHSAFLKNIFPAFLSQFVYGSLAGLVFLYLFSHEDFFPLAREIEKEEEKKEEKWLKRLKHHGKIFVCLMIGALGGPVLGALSVRLLLHRHHFWYKYGIVVFSDLISTVISLGLVKGFVGVLF